MKRRLATVMVGMVMVTSAIAGDYYSEGDNGFYAKGRVINADPIYQTVRVNHPEERCWNERVRHRAPARSDSYTPMIAGAIVGGVVGNQFGKGSGKDAMTVAGALLGGSVGNDLGKRGSGRSYVTNERRCEMVDHYTEKRQLSGYRVKYKYDGKTFWTHTNNHPGRYINLHVSVAPTDSADHDFQEYD